MVTIAVCGTGTMASLWAQTVAALAGHRLVAVVSRDPGRARRLAAAYDATAVTPDALPAGTALTVVAGAPATRTADALAAIAAGSAVVVEAPLARTLAEADRLVEAAEAGAVVACAENLLFAPLVRDALHRVAGLGPLQYLEARVVQPRPRRFSPTDAGWGGGVLFDSGPHPLAVVLAMAGDDQPVSVSARLERDPSPSRAAVEDRARVELTFRSGARGVVDLRWQDAPAQWDLQVATASSALRLELQPDPHVEQLGVDLPRPPRRFPGVEPVQLEQFGYLDQALELSRDLPSGAEPWPGVRFGRYVLEVVCAAAHSAGTGEPEPLPFRRRRTSTPWELWRHPEPPAPPAPPAGRADGTGGR